MRAIVYTRYGPPDTLQIQEIDKPVPRDDEVLISVHATSVTAADCIMRKGEPAWGRLIIGIRKPRKRFAILGCELAGVVEAVGKDVTRFKPGDQVFGFTGFGVSAYAEYKCMPETASLAIRPANTTYEESAAAVDGATTALFFLRDQAHLQRGQRVLIVGASGSIGTYAVQLAKHFGAHVTGVCSTGNLDLVTSLGADRVIDYTKEDFADGNETYDVVFDTVGKSAFSHCKGSLTDTGCYVPTVGLKNVLLKRWTAMTGGKRVVSGMSIDKRDALVFIRNLIESNQLRIVIDRRYPLEQIAEAHRYVDKGHKKGNVVITMRQAS
jgi:NADPH2:quinone reductase